MGMEIERKFLVVGDAWRGQAARTQRMVQGYLVDARALVATRSSVRVRIAGAEAWLNIKSAELGVSRQEYEYAIPRADAEAMLRDLCDGVVEKTRHHVPYGGALFEVDEFHGANAGLIVAELELKSEEESFPRPPWLGREVSLVPRYYNVQLVHHPYAHWSAAEQSGAV